jgi:hypothetical protein
MRFWSVAILAQAYPKLSSIVCCGLRTSLTMVQLEKVDYGGTAMVGASNIEMTRTARRRAQRKHTHQCLVKGIQQLKYQTQVFTNQVKIDQHGYMDTVALSLALQLTDCQHLGHNVHFSSVASLAAKEAGWKTSSEHRRHLRTHKEANLIKHNVYDLLSNTQEYGEAQHRLPPMPNGILAIDLESFRASQHDHVSKRDDVVCNSCTLPETNAACGLTCSWCGLWQPLNLVTNSCIAAADTSPDSGPFLVDAEETADAVNEVKGSDESLPWCLTELESMWQGCTESLLDSIVVSASYDGSTSSFTLGQGPIHSKLTCRLEETDSDDLLDWSEALEDMYYEGRLQVEGEIGSINKFLRCFGHWQLPDDETAKAYEPDT